VLREKENGRGPGRGREGGKNRQAKFSAKKEVKSSLRGSYQLMYSGEKRGIGRVTDGRGGYRKGKRLYSIKKKTMNCRRNHGEIQLTRRAPSYRLAGGKRLTYTGKGEEEKALTRGDGI